MKLVCVALLEIYSNASIFQLLDAFSALAFDLIADIVQHQGIGAREPNS